MRRNRASTSSTSARRASAARARCGWTASGSARASRRHGIGHAIARRCTVHHNVQHAVHPVPKRASLPSLPSPRQVPYVEPGQTYKVQVKSSMKQAKSSSRFYSFRCDSAAVHPPHAQRTPPALAPGAKPNAQPDPFWRVQLHLRRDEEQHHGHGRLRARGAQVAGQVPPTCASVATTTRARPGPRCRPRAPALAPPHPAPCLVPCTSMPTGSRSPYISPISPLD